MASIGMFPKQYQDLFAQSNASSAAAYTPNSHSNVGAALMTNTGDVYVSANMEFTKNADHAEQLACALAMTDGFKPGDLAALASSKPACGNCRQELEDLNPYLTQIWKDATGNFKQATTSDRLPEPYHRDHENPPGPVAPANVTDPLMAAAYKARQNSFVIRSHYPMGVAIQSMDGKIYKGSQVEASSFPTSAGRVALGAAVLGQQKFENLTDMAIVGGSTPTGELPKELPWDTLEALHNVVPNINVHFPEGDGVKQMKLNELIQHYMQQRLG